MKKKNGAIKIINGIASSVHNPLRFEGADMKPNILIMCKLLFALLIIHGFYFSINDPFIPFISFFDEFKSDFSIFKNSITGLFFTSGFFLVFNYRVRLMSILIGLVVIITLLASKPVFSNHKFFCGCLFLLAGLSNKKDDPWLIYIQLSILYLGAAINKAFQIDWWNGAFMQNWMVNRLQNEMFIELASFLPAFLMAKIISISTIMIEFLLSILVFFRKRHTIMVFTMLIFHTSLYMITSLRFGHFFENMLLVTLVFLKWPKTNIIVYNIKDVWYKNPLKILQSMNYFVIDKNTNDKGNWLQIKYNNRIIINFEALRDLLLYNPLFYIFLFALDILIRIIFNGNQMHAIHMSFISILILSFLVMSLVNFKKKS